MSEEKKKPTLTELATMNKNLTGDLELYTTARNFLAKQLSGEYVQLPQLELSMVDKQPPSYKFDLNKVPTQEAELILSILLEHSERMAVDTWNRIANNAVTACGIIEQMKKQHEPAQEEVPPPDPADLDLVD